MTSISFSPTAGRYHLGDAVRSEWTKLSSVRSSRWTLVIFAVLTIAIGTAVSVAYGTHWPHMSAASRTTWDPTNETLAGLAFGELAIGVLGALAMTGEYSSGSIRSTLAAVPRRRLVLGAKAAVVGAVGLVVGEAVTVTTFLIGQATLGPAPHASLGQPGVARTVLLSGAFLGLIALFGLGLGTIIRNSAGAVAAFAGTVLVLPLALSPFPGDLSRFAPEAILSSSVAAVRPDVPHLGPWVGMGMMALYALAALAVGALVLSRRDA